MYQCNKLKTLYLSHSPPFFPFFLVCFKCFEITQHNFRQKSLFIFLCFNLLESIVVFFFVSDPCFFLFVFILLKIQEKKKNVPRVLKNWKIVHLGAYLGLGPSNQKTNLNDFHLLELWIRMVKNKKNNRNII